MEDRREIGQIGICPPGLVGIVRDVPPGILRIWGSGDLGISGALLGECWVGAVADPV